MAAQGGDKCCLRSTGLGGNQRQRSCPGSHCRTSGCWPCFLGRRAPPIALGSTLTWILRWRRELLVGGGGSKERDVEAWLKCLGMRLRQTQSPDYW